MLFRGGKGDWWDWERPVVYVSNQNHRACRLQKKLPRWLQNFQKYLFSFLVDWIEQFLDPRLGRTLQCWWQVLGSPIQGDFFFEVVVLFGMTRQWHSMIHVGRPINHQKFSSENYACSSFELCVGLRKSSLNSSSC